MKKINGNCWIFQHSSLCNRKGMQTKKSLKAMENLNKTYRKAAPRPGCTDEGRQLVCVSSELHTQ